MRLGNNVCGKTLQGAQLTAKMRRRGGVIVMLAQHQPTISQLNNAARAAKPGMGLRRDEAMLGKVARQDLCARRVIVAKPHLYLTR